MDVLQTYGDPAAALDIDRGLTAFVGGGGKTTLLFALGRALQHCGRTVLSTSTHMYRPDTIPVLDNPTETDLDAALRSAPLVFAGCAACDGKMTASHLPWEQVTALSDYVLVEADGSKGFPVKAPAAHEPVLPICTCHVVAVAGLRALGKPICETAHRPELLGALLGVEQEHRLTPSDLARVLQSEIGQRKGVMEHMRFSIVLNQADDVEALALGRKTAEHLNPKLVDRVLITSLQAEVSKC